MNSILRIVCPEMVEKVFGELSKLDLALMPNFGERLTATEPRAREILQQHIAKGVQEVVLRLFNDDVSRSG